MRPILAVGLLLSSTLPQWTNAASATPAPSIVIHNGGFEAPELAPWKSDSGGFVVDSSVKHSGASSLKVTGGPEARSLTSGKFPIDIDTVYTLSLWIKTQGISTPDGFSVEIFQRNDSTGWSSWYPTSYSTERRVIKSGGSQEWTEYRFSFTPDPTADGFEIVLGVDAGVTGTAWIDDVSLSLTSTRIAQRDFTGDWNNVQTYGDQVRWVDKAGAVDNLEITLPQGTYSLWLSMLGDGHPDIEVKADGKLIGLGAGSEKTGWRKLGSVDLAAGAHHFTLKNLGGKNEAAYAGMVVSTEAEPVLPDFSGLFGVKRDKFPITLYPAKPTDSRLAICFASYLVETGWDGATGLPSAGAARIASLAHKYGIPVTWLVNNKSAVAMKDLLTKWHEEYGDDVASFDFEDWGPITEALPWASTNFAAVGEGRTRPVQELEDAGMIGAWGWTWGQEGVDHNTDKGCPWAPFYASHNNNNESYKIPANYPGKVLGVEWTQRDLNKATDIHSGDPCVFSMDPDDVRERVVYGRNIDYWRQFLDEYLRNTEWNDFIPFIVHQESHEMNWAFSWKGPWGMDEEQAFIRARKGYNLDAEALDEFFKYAKSKNVSFMTLPQMAAAYQRKYPSVTPPHYMVFRDIPTQTPLRYASPGAPVHPGPYPLSFFFFDNECQMVFEDTLRLPRVIFNYTHQYASGHLGAYPREAFIPGIVSFTKNFSDGEETWKITVSNPNSYVVPMGITEWGDYSNYELAKASDTVKEVKRIGNTLEFIRFNAAPGNTELNISYKVKGKPFVAADPDQGRETAWQGDFSEGRWQIAGPASIISDGEGALINYEGGPYARLVTASPAGECCVPINMEKNPVLVVSLGKVENVDFFQINAWNGTHSEKNLLRLQPGGTVLQSDTTLRIPLSKTGWSGDNLSNLVITIGNTSQSKGSLELKSLKVLND